MAQRYPELVFTRGAQHGQRVQLLKTMNILGRDRTCDVAVQDEYASRQHCRIIVEGARVRVVNTSPNGTRVNGKAVESADLKDGDLIGLGLECEVRYEAATAPAGATGPVPSGAAPPVATPVAPKAAAAPAEPAVEIEAEKPRRRFKKPSMLVWVGIYALCLTAVFTVIRLQCAPTRPQGKRDTGPLTGEKIKEIFDEPLRAVRNDRLADEALARANTGYKLWKTGTTGPGHLYATLRDYKMAQAHRGVEFFDDAYVQTQMNEVKAALVEEVTICYRNAYAYQRQGNWQRSADEYRYVLRLVPDQTHKVYGNVRAQLNLVQAALIQAKKRSGPKQW